MKINNKTGIIIIVAIVLFSISYTIIKKQNNCPDGKVRTYNSCSCKYVCQSPNLIGGVCADSVCDL